VVLSDIQQHGSKLQGTGEPRGEVSAPSLVYQNKFTEVGSALQDTTVSEVPVDCEVGGVGGTRPTNPPSVTIFRVTPFARHHDNRSCLPLSPWPEVTLLDTIGRPGVALADELFQR
jgi:hypothetical protein